MKLTYAALGAVTFSIGMNLRHVLGPLPWGATKISLWLLAILLLAGVHFGAVRTVRRLPTAGVEESRRAVYALTLQALVIIALALALPEVVQHALGP